MTVVPRPAALGFRPHTGWTVGLVLALDGGRPRLVDRRRLDLAPADLQGAPQPYHAAQTLSAEAGQALLDQTLEAARRLAGEALLELLGSAALEGCRVLAAGLVGVAPRDEGSLAEVLASHARMHAAEGALYQEVLRQACAGAGLPLTGVAARELPARAATVLGQPALELDRTLDALGRELGPPWRQDHRLATLAAWLALTSAPG